MFVLLGGHLARLMSCDALRRLVARPVLSTTGNDRNREGHAGSIAMLLVATASPGPPQTQHAQQPRANGESLRHSYHGADTCQVKFM